MNQWKERSDFPHSAYDSFVYDQVKTGSSRGNVHCNWFILPPLLPTLTIWFSLDHKRNISDGVVSGIGRKWKRSDSSDSDSVALMTPLKSPIFLFSLGHKRCFDSAYDSNSDSIVCENQSSDHVFCCGSVILYPWFKFYFSLFLGMLNYIYNNEFETEKNEKH